MSDPFIGEIQIYGFNFAPYNWAMCQGQIMPIQQNTALFSLLGVQFGGNGQTTYALPNFAGNAASGQGQGPGLSPRTVGETFGSASVTLQSDEMPMHTHGARIYNQPVAANRAGIPAAGDAIITPESAAMLTSNNAVNTTLPSQTIGMTGGNQPHENRQPYLALNFCISLAGVFPQRP
ncbi:phage tail protein [Fulvimonas soli]|uniref:Microcystin-dependent protein n=1 Tax=Fulvimonas soli TaxID=155197 RepID=A0A316I629_9GAMM|nr:tail fiber protein [Fulvimonas soli]PWK85927.1 microcystin-dependent protein [Fulvimonas soli]TNY26979.1 microcystin-dependent protein [Fulvimonas soli]